MIACKEGFIEIVEYLVLNGVDIKNKDNVRITNEWYMILYHDDFFLFFKTGRTAFLHACMGGQFKVVQLLKDRGAMNFDNNDKV